MDSKFYIVWDFKSVFNAALGKTKLGSKVVMGTKSDILAHFPLLPAYGIDIDELFVQHGYVYEYIQPNLTWGEAGNLYLHPKILAAKPIVQPVCH